MTIRIKDDSLPSNENVVPRIGFDEVLYRPDEPPPSMLPKPKPPPAPSGQGSELYFAASTDGWMIASENTRLASAQIGWTKLSRLKRQSTDKVGRKG